MVKPSHCPSRSNPYANSLSRNRRKQVQKITNGIEFAGKGRFCTQGEQGSEVEEKQTDWENYIETSAKVLGLSLEADWKAAITANLETVFKIAAAVDAFELPDDAEPAPIFEA
jgi:hypothetical protein